MPASIPAPSMNRIICQIGIPRDSIRRGNALTRLFDPLFIADDVSVHRFK